MLIMHSVNASLQFVIPGFLEATNKTSLLARRKRDNGECNEGPDVTNHIYFIVTHSPFLTYLFTTYIHTIRWFAKGT